MDHDLRAVLAGEAQARPTLPVPRAALVLHEARLDDGDGGKAARAYAEALARDNQVAAPPREADHALIALKDGGTLKWERHGEFSTWTWVCEGAFDQAGPIVPPALFADAPGRRLVAAALFVSPDEPDGQTLDRVFGPESAEVDRAGSIIASGTCGFWTGFRLGADGWTRFLTQENGTGPFRMGRIVRRLLEVETYRLVALLAFPLAKRARRTLDALDAQVAAAIADTHAPEADVLNTLLDAARKLEALGQETSFRFGAAAAYRTLVAKRLEEFREVRIEGIQRLQAYLERRFTPAMDTCASTQRRIESLSARVERASGLLRTRIDLATQAQNQALLRSMHETARTQVRLQEAVEGFSVAAIAYYAYSLLATILAPAANAALADDWSTAWKAALAAAVTFAVWFGLRTSRRAFGAKERQINENNQHGSID
jgi:uncharacterized membrane-anchored protein